MSNPRWRSARVPIREEADVPMARLCVRKMAAEEGLPELVVEALALAISELAHNILVHAGSGEVLVEPLVRARRRGIRVIACDRGPGIPDLETAMRDGYSTAGGLGLGLSATRRLVDEFSVESTAGAGTTVTIEKWGA